MTNEQLAIHLLGIAREMNLALTEVDKNLQNLNFPPQDIVQILSPAQSYIDLLRIRARSLNPTATF